MFFESEKLGRWRIYPKGRRFGATRGASVAFIKWMMEGEPCLWGDTINGNIDRYVERFFEPFCLHHGIRYEWKSQQKLFKIGKGYTDFRSADRPENWEGFGYKKIFLNEAGIILNDLYLYNNAVLPMMIDYPDSTLIAAGTPKLTRGIGKKFKELWDNVEKGEPGYTGRRFTTYDNPWLTKESISQLEYQIAASERKQEIGGEFMDASGIAIPIEWFQRYNLPPENFIRCIQSWDTASSKKEVNDPSVCTTWLETKNMYYLVHVFREWLEYPSLKRNTINLAEHFKPNLILIENKSSGISLLQELRSETRLPLRAIDPVQDKITRALTSSTLIEAGKVSIPNKATWLFPYEKEWTDFPLCETFDQIDSTSQFLNWVKGLQGNVLIG